MVRMDNAILEKSKAFAVRIVNLYRHLVAEKHEFTLAKQILKSGTSVGANCREATRAQSTADFISKMNIALKEADETAYWLELLQETGYLTKGQYESIYTDCQALIKLLVRIVKTTRIKVKN